MAIHEVEVQVQTLSPCGFNEGSLIRKWFLEEKRERATGFKDGENTDQAVLDSIASGQLSRRLVFVDVGCKVSKGPSLFFSHCYGVILHAFGVLEQERFQIAEIHIQAIKKLRHRPTGHNGEVAAK